MILFDFSVPGSALWSPIDDRVMGGISQSRMEAGAGVAVFTGELSLERNGGFCFVRSAPARLDCRGHAGLALRGRGDGQRYKLRLRLDERFDGLHHEADFGTRADEWDEPRLAFADFRARFRGLDVPAAAALDPARITTLGLMIAERQVGPFRLEVAWIRALR